MDKIKYRMFTWPENPETFEIQAVRAPMYKVGTDGAIIWQGIGPLCRTIRSRGVFHGPKAHGSYNALAVIMANGAAGDLVHPVWGTMSAYITELHMLQESREDFVAYEIVFREANATGEIPRLPSIKDPY